MEIGGLASLAAIRTQNAQGNGGNAHKVMENWRRFADGGKGNRPRRREGVDACGGCG